MWPFSAARCNCKVRLDGKTVVITGATSGIGKATALDLVRKGARVIMASLDLNEAEAAADDIRRELRDADNVGEVLFVRIDLGSLQSVRQCAQHLLRTEKEIHILINNAGIILHPKKVTEEGIEIHMCVNYMGHFLFTCLLLPRIIRSAPARIVNVTSVAHKYFRTVHMDDLGWENRRFNPYLAYGESKLALILTSTELGARLKGTGVTTYSVHPGLVHTNIIAHLDKGFLGGFYWLLKKIGSSFVKNPEQGAQTSIHCAVAESLANETGEYYSGCKKSSASSLVRNSELRETVWRESARRVGLGDWDPFTAEDTGSIPDVVAQ